MRIWPIALFSTFALSACEKKESTKTETAVKTPATATKTENPPPQSDEDIGEVIARINGISIGSKDFERAASRKIPANGKSLSEKERKEIIDQLVEEELLYQMAFSRKLYRDPKVKKVMMNALLRKEVYASVKGTDINEADLKSYYEEHKEDFTIPEKIQFSRILIKIKADRDETAAQAEADRIYTALRKNPSSFRDVAEKKSDGPYSRRGGDVGFVSQKGKPGLDPEVVSKAFELKTSQLSKPFQTKEGFNIVFLKERRDKQVRSFKTAQGTVMRKIKNDRIAEKYDSYTDSLRQGASVEVDMDKINAIEVKSSPRPTLAPGAPSLKLPQKK